MMIYSGGSEGRDEEGRTPEIVSFWRWSGLSNKL